MTVSFPENRSLVKESYIVPYLQYGIHIVGIHYRSDAQFFGQAADELVYDDRCLGIKS